MYNELVAQLLKNSVAIDSSAHRYQEIKELYKLAIERCSYLMENPKYRKIILAEHDQIIILAKGYFQGFYEALQLINDLLNDQIKLKCS